MSSHGIVIDIIGDERSYVRAAQNAMSVNSKLDASFKQVGVNANLSADAQIKAAVKAREAMVANVTALSSRASTLPAGSPEQLAALGLAADAQRKLEHSYGATGRSAATAERSIGKATRGALAGTGIFHGLGRSLAFASGGYLAFAGASALVSDAIHGAEDLEKAQHGLATAIEHTGGNVAVLGAKYERTARAEQQFGIDDAAALTGLARATVLTGDAASAQRAYAEALVISKATGKDFNAVLTATSKGQEGVTTSLQRYGILIAKGTPGQQQYFTVMSRFAGQARANTTEGDRFNATLHNSEEIIGTAILPTLNEYLGELGSWLNKMNRSGRLQKDVNGIVQTGAHVFHALGDAVGFVDKVTGGLANTLKLLLALKVASVLSGWAGGFKGLAGAEAAAAASAAGGAGAGAAAGGVAARVGMYTGAGAAAGAAAGGSGFSTLGRFGAGVGALFGAIPDTMPLGSEKVVSGWKFYSVDGKGWIRGPYVGFDSPRVPDNGAILGGPAFLQTPWQQSVTSSTTGSPFGGAPSATVWTKKFNLRWGEQLAQAQAALTQTTTDDVAAAKQVVARIKSLMAQGRLKGAALLQALGLEASAMSTIWSAEDAAAQKRAQAAQAAQQRIQAQIQDSIDPLRLEVALSRDQALGHSIRKDLLRLRAAAEKALRSGKLSLDQQRQAWDQIASLNQQLANQSNAATAQFKQASTRALTAGLHLTAAQRRELRARLSQLGPGGTRPRDGEGAFGYEIGRNGRPIHVHTTVKLDGKKVASSTTKHQQQRRRRNSSQRRGPNTGASG